MKIKSIDLTPFLDKKDIVVREDYMMWTEVSTGKRIIEYYTPYGIIKEYLANYETK